MSTTCSSREARDIAWSAVSGGVVAAGPLARWIDVECHDTAEVLKVPRCMYRGKLFLISETCFILPAPLHGTYLSLSLKVHCAVINWVQCSIAV